MEDILKILRNQIDTIDEEIIYLLSRRFEITKQIWQVKKNSNTSILQVWRWDELMDNLLSEAKDKWVSDLLVKDIWNLIHKESIRLQKLKKD